jgi:prepilin-type N-terminal cleavage/methylation domain-containing protein
LTRKGFTLIELLVVIVIIGILVAIALPNFIKIKDKAKEAEVKQNLHSIQLAIERYQVDNGASYPYFLYGGESSFNMGTFWALYPGSSYWHYPSQQQKRNAFDMFWMQTNTWDYNDGNWNNLLNGTSEGTFGDTLQYEGYLPKYPRNPFQAGQGKKPYGIDWITFGNGQYNACFGGRSGELMWNTAPSGEQPKFVLYSDTPPQSNQYPGNFQYHPRWQDGATNYGHIWFQSDANGGNNTQGQQGRPYHAPPLNDGIPNSPASYISSLEVNGYDILATGSVRTKGQDLDNSLLNGILHWGRTGYLTLGQERNPWVNTGQYPNVQAFGERPYSDSIPDAYIIHLGSGMDKKVTDPLTSN